MGPSSTARIRKRDSQYWTENLATPLPSAHERERERDARERGGSLVNSIVVSAHGGSRRGAALPPQSQSRRVLSERERERELSTTESCSSSVDATAAAAAAAAALLAEAEQSEVGRAARRGCRTTVTSLSGGAARSSRDTVISTTSDDPEAELLSRWAVDEATIAASVWPRETLLRGEEGLLPRFEDVVIPKVRGSPMCVVPSATAVALDGLGERDSCS